ncbi:hypothetical protein APHCRT_0134 [Anaplasma phagocytophilum str. CRT53-1]|uniref:Uncharacterized protein n=1 Tax=Anaplasma phagocytophilum str. CRT53-1 TaxID=1359157 RepID=A0A0F3Q822_ANAPH|nr:hypothetical protein APHCRT_0134 [Anaplasma phagocytophilum str. CRT53-1]
MLHTNDIAKHGEHSLRQRVHAGVVATPARFMGRLVCLLRLGLY